MNKKEDTFSYKGWLISDSFVKRSFAALGYQMMATLFIYLGIFAIIASSILFTMFMRPVFG